MADQDAHIGFGAQLQKADSNSPPNYISVMGIKSISGPKMARDAKETTDNNSPGAFRTYIGGLIGRILERPVTKLIVGAGRWRVPRKEDLTTLPGAELPSTGFSGDSGKTRKWSTTRKLNIRVRTLGRTRSVLLGGHPPSWPARQLAHCRWVFLSPAGRRPFRLDLFPDPTRGTRSSSQPSGGTGCFRLQSRETLASVHLRTSSADSPDLCSTLPQLCRNRLCK